MRTTDDIRPFIKTPLLDSVTRTRPILKRAGSFIDMLQTINKYTPLWKEHDVFRAFPQWQSPIRASRRHRSQELRWWRWCTDVQRGEADSPPWLQEAREIPRHRAASTRQRRAFQQFREASLSSHAERCPWRHANSDGLGAHRTRSVTGDISSYVSQCIERKGSRNKQESNNGLIYHFCVTNVISRYNNIFYSDYVQCQLQ